jgi:hypothetical protein
VKVIKGWTEAMLRMKEGDHWQLYVPAELACVSRPFPLCVFVTFCPLPPTMCFCDILCRYGGASRLHGRFFLRL